VFVCVYVCVYFFLSLSLSPPRPVGLCVIWKVKIPYLLCVIITAVTQHLSSASIYLTLNEYIQLILNDTKG